MIDKLTIKGARTHNLKNIDLEIPKNTLTVITGVSGSGKSSLAFDTIYAEGQRRYVESLSAYARQFLDLMDKPEVDLIEGLSPAISIDQKSAGRNPRSTVGTTTEIYDYLRLLFARAGHAYCPNGHGRVQAQSIQEIVDSVLDNGEVDQKLMILSPIVKDRKGTYEELFTKLSKEGYARLRVDGVIHNIEDDIKLERYQKHTIEVIVDRIRLKDKEDKSFLKRLTDSIELSINLSQGEVLILTEKGDSWLEKLYSEKHSCKVCGFSFREIEPHTFSFNSPHGACDKCGGLGSISEVDPDLVYNPKLTVMEGAIYPWSRASDNEDSWRMQTLKAVADEEGFSLREPLKDLTPEALNTLLYGVKDKKFAIKYTSKYRGTENTYETEYEGVIPNLMRKYEESDSDFVRKEIENYMRELICPQCAGKRLSKESLAITILTKNIYDITTLSISEVMNWIKNAETDDNSEDHLTNQEKEIVEKVTKEISARLNFLLAVGLEYLSLGRTARTLSGGESQRIRLASQIGSGLTGVLYVLDEPSIGLHQRDNDRLLKTLKNLKQLGNTVIVVEHDEDTIKSADYLIDIGPGAGEHGGKVVAAGTIDEVMKNKDSITVKYLTGEKQVSRKQIKKISKDLINKKIENKNSLIIKGARENNLKNIDVEIPLGKFVTVTGVSGSGKSSLINEILYKKLANDVNKSKVTPGLHSTIEGIENVDKVVNIDQSPIGRTPRSNPATYTGVFTYIREIFAKTNEAKVRGYTTGRFSFNVKGGRCENCKGDGQIKIEMQFLPDVYVTCEVCKGQRYNREALQIDYKGKNIAQVLDMTVEEGVEFFSNIPRIESKLTTLNQVGLGYIKLGQSALTLSGGEAQRVKLATELSKRQTGKTIYILDEPTTGLHFDDVYKLLIVLHSLVEQGNSVVVIEHNMDLIKTSDWIIDLGPEGGDEGGEIVAVGTPEQVAKVEKSYTGQWLKKSIG